MTTATVNTPPVAAEVRPVGIFRRFAWKEFRMLQSLWLAVFAMSAMVEWAVNAFTPALDQAMTLFCMALGATVLYAVGAASTIFSVEHEEETYDFIAGLPATWWPVFTGKLAVVLSSAVALAASLAVVGWILCGFDAPGGNDTPAALGLFGVAVLEGVAWGTLFSLLVTRPLVAAMLTIVVGAVTVNVLVNLSSSYAVAGMNPDAYVDAVPFRLVVTAIVLLAGGVLASRWLVTDTAAATDRVGTFGWWNPLRTRSVSRLRSADFPTSQASRRTLLARLVWQTWCEARKLLLVPLGIAFLLMLGISAATVVTIVRTIPEFTPAVLVCTLFFVPALYGAMAFSADQRRQRYRFLAEHAARPRYVWLARHIVWLGTLLIVAAAFFLLALALSAVALRFSTADALGNFLRYGTRTPEMDYSFIEATRVAVQGTTLAAIGMLAAYGIGQLSSMLVRSEILAAFFALVLSVFLSAWIALVFAWQLSGWLLVFPLAAGLMLATWLRAPHWIAGRNSWRSWINPALAVVAAVTLVAVALPSARLHQIRSGPASITHLQPRPARITPLVPANSPLDSPQARETAGMYRQAVVLMHSWRQNNLLDRWARPEYMEDGSVGPVGGIDEAKIPPDQLHQFREALLSHEKLMRDTEAAAVKLATDASARPFCYFDFDVRQISNAPRQPQRPWKWKLDSVAGYQELNGLLVVLWATGPEVSFDRTLTALRMSDHLAAGQPSVIWLDQMQHQQQILGRIGVWAAQDVRTREELESALAQLNEHFRLWGSLQEALYADHRLVRDVLAGDQPPLVLTEEPDSLPVQLAVILNEFPWERRRALEALEEITRQNVADADELARYIVRSTPSDPGNMWIRRWLRSIASYPAHWPANWVLACPAAATSYLARFEYAARTPVHELYRAYCDSEVCRRAALLQFALAMYRLDHGEYPAWLSELVPTYLETVPLDPYTGQPFQYEPEGLNLPLVPWSAGSNFQQIDPYTPFLWSAGPGNAALKRWDRTRRFDNADDATGEVFETVSEPVYVLATQEPSWWDEPALAFPLTSSSSSETDTENK